jgi:non-specific serine/threonine protein kinase
VHLQQLQECSLVLAEEAGEAMRYRLLETLREYGWEQLRASGELSATRDRHRDWYRQFAEQAESAARGAAEPARLTIELDNVRAALTWCLEEAEGDPAGDAAAVGLRLATALRGFWGSQVYGEEAVQWLEAALARGSQLPPALRAPALLQTAFVAQHSLEQERCLTLFQAARKEYEEVVRLARGEQNPLALVRALLSLANAVYHCGDLDTTWTCCVEARRLLETMAAPLERVHMLGVMARVPISREGWPAARPLLEEQLAICRQLGDADSLLHALGAMGHVERDDGNHAHAEALYRESLLLRRKVGNLWAVAMSFEDLATVASRQGRQDRAARLLGAGEALCETMAPVLRSPTARTMNALWRRAAPPWARPRSPRYGRKAGPSRRKRPSASRWSNGWTAVNTTPGPTSVRDNRT